MTTHSQSQLSLIREPQLIRYRPRWRRCISCLCVAGEVQSGREGGRVLAALPPPPGDGGDALRQTDVGDPERGDRTSASSASSSVHIHRCVQTSSVSPDEVQEGQRGHVQRAVLSAAGDAAHSVCEGHGGDAQRGEDEPIAPIDPDM